MTTLSQEPFIPALSGDLGPEEQLLAFRNCWDWGHGYVRLLKQSALGCSRLASSDPQVEAELNALFMVLIEVEAWFARCGQELKEVRLNPDVDRAIH